MRAILSKIEVMCEEPLIHNEAVVIKDYKDYYKFGKFDMFDVVRVSWHDEDISIYLDDEGMLKPSNYGRRVQGYEQPLFGNLIVTGGVDREGNTLACPEWLDAMNIAEFIGDIEFITKG